ncbi:hypothetical protein Bca101_054451 [Brassica carinata]
MVETRLQERSLSEQVDEIRSLHDLLAAELNLEQTHSTHASTDLKRCGLIPYLKLLVSSRQEVTWFIKPENFLLFSKDENAMLKATDFGLVTIDTDLIEMSTCSKTSNTLTKTRAGKFSLVEHRKLQTEKLKQYSETLIDLAFIGLSTVDELKSPRNSIWDGEMKLSSKKL